MQLGQNIAAIVTGGASGLGGATARALAGKGVKVAIFDLNQELGETVAREIVSNVIIEGPAFWRRVFEVPHVEVKASAVQQKAAIPRRLFVIPVVQIERTGAHFFERMIFHPSRPRVGRLA